MAETVWGMLPAEALAVAEEPGVNQLVTVRALCGSEAYLSCFVRTGDTWERRVSSAAWLGRRGVGKAREGDGKTPLGAFGLSTPFGILPAPADAAEEYLQVGPEHYWCGQNGPYYNRLIDMANPPDDYFPSRDDEHLIAYAPSYHYGMFIGYNEAGAPHLGSAIFLHCTGSRPYTAGCVAVPEDVMCDLLGLIREGAKIVIYE